ncbi:chitin synthase-domain-containing protein [Sphaerosporella brunnea]|uniref:chitin synthase n=1 Tax=Sphaerosporella brunnea TaxID=1250544 RepID=A0A5J5ENL5_9PEZI|nr:chitin synthase-domain-containing protein [Sphaerosporella brunnea]
MTTTPALTGPWKVSEIVYCSIMGAVMIAALLEWFLWLAAFLYCLVKAFQKAEKWHSRVLAVVVMILFTAFRCIFLPVMVVTLPLPSRITRHFPTEMVSFLQWFAFWTFAILLTVPWLFCIYQLVTNNLGRHRRIKSVLDESTAPKVVVVMPVYNEHPSVLLTAVDSIVDGDYPPSCLHIFLSFDGADENELYLKSIESLGVPLSLESYPSSLDVTYRGMRITVSRFKHGGKRHCQKRTFKLIDKVYIEYLKRNDNLFILFIDSDCILDKVCIQNFVYEMELKPGSKQNMLAMTGVITSTAKKQSLITLLQDMEYIHGQLFERSVESACGSVTCLPGALTILRFSAFRKMAKYYFADKAEQCEDLFDYGKCHLGEDRWLTHLFMIGASERYQIQMCTGAFCKTEAVLTFQSLLKQRRRWFLGFITNEVCMLTDARLWIRYPILCIVRFMQNTIRTTALLFFVMVLSIITTTQKINQLPVGFIAVSLGLNWALMVYFGLRLKRFKAWLYPLMFVINPFFNWLYMVYGIFTAGQRTWGGPRADAGAADAQTTPREAIEKAEAQGDDLQVVPESFRPAIEAQRQAAAELRQRIPDGRTRAEEQLSGLGSYYSYPNDSMGTLPDNLPRNPNAPHVPLHPRDSFDSFISAASTAAGGSVYFPRRVESIMGEEDRRKYQVAQANQKEAGGAYMVQSRRAGSPDSSEDIHGYKLAENTSSSSVDSSTSNYGYFVAGSSTFTSQSHSPGGLHEDRSSPVSIVGPLHLVFPDQVHRPSARPIAAARSPLARLSLVRTSASDDEEENGTEATVIDAARPDSSSPESTSLPGDVMDGSDEREGRPKERRRLQKKPK